MTTITNEMICGNIAYENGEYKISGDYKVDPSTKKLNALNVSINKSDAYVGNVNTYQNGEELVYNYNGMKQEDVTLIAEQITTLITELESKYANMTLTSI